MSNRSSLAAWWKDSHICGDLGMSEIWQEVDQRNENMCKNFDKGNVNRCKKDDKGNGSSDKKKGKGSKRLLSGRDSVTQFKTFDVEEG